MRILVVGASNSLVRGGYIDRATKILSRNVQTKLEVTNVSVGGTSLITGISRIFELPKGAKFDIIIYEYGINNESHFSPRQGGEQIVKSALQILIGILAERFPDALFFPVMFAMQHLFSSHIANKIYDAERAVWAETQNPALDVRQRLAFLLAHTAPDWLYSDTAHYSVPYGTDLVGSIVARGVLELATAQDRQSLRDLDAKLRALPVTRPIALRHMSSEDLAERAYGNVELVARRNSVMSASALRIRPGGGLKIEERPFNISVLSDRHHDWVRLTRGEGARARSWALGTRFMGVDNPAANPGDADRFFYSGIPLPLVLQPDAPFLRDLTPFDFALETRTRDKPSPIAFDGFKSGADLTDSERWVDIAGMTFIADA